MRSSPARSWLPTTVLAIAQLWTSTAWAGDCWTVTRMVAVDEQGRSHPTELLHTGWRVRDTQQRPIAIGLEICPGDALRFHQARIELQHATIVADHDQPETAVLHNDSSDDATVTLDQPDSWDLVGLQAAWFKLHQVFQFRYDRWLNGSNEGTELTLITEDSGVMAATLRGRFQVGSGAERIAIDQGQHAAFSAQASRAFLGEGESPLTNHPSPPSASRSNLRQRDRFATQGWLRGSPIWLVGGLVGPVLMGDDPGLKFHLYTRLRTVRWLRLNAELAPAVTTRRSTVYDADGDGVPSMAQELTIWHVPLSLGLELGPAPLSLSPQALLVVECSTEHSTTAAQPTNGCTLRPHPGGLLGLRGELMRRRGLGLLWSVRGGALLGDDDRVSPYIDLALGLGGGL